jgi:predicted alpha-1,2-mannosidase
MKKFFIISLIAILASCNHQKDSMDFASYVNPFVGTGGHGHTFPGATVPFGMVQLSPDTRVDGSWDGCSGYHYSDSIIYGFSHTHLSGTGVSDYGDLMFMPTIGATGFEQEDYRASFSHDNEKAEPGFYEVTLDNGIHVELTTSTRVGMHRYTFPEGKSSVIIDLTHRDELLEGGIELLDDKTLTLKRVSKAWATEQHAYGYVQFSNSFSARFNEDSTKVILDIELDDTRELLVKVGFSFVNEKGGQRNLAGEVPHWDFEQVKAEARTAWNNELKKIEVQDTDTEKLKVFYTALYHVMIHPNVAMDIDGQYRGMDQQLHKAEGFTYYTVFSLWDTFRATHPLFTIIDQKRTNDFLQTFMAHYQQGGRLPVWELASNETDCMIGYHSVSVITDAYAKGIRDFDVNLAYEAMKKSATWDHLGLPAYQKYGFLSVDDEHESVSKTLEYAYDDWCIAQMALELGHVEEYKIYMNRSNAWRNLLDPETNLMRPRKNGGWLTPFDPREVNNHFTEGNSWQYSFFVPQDVHGMIAAMGGANTFEQKLDELFSAENETTGRTQVDITGLVGQYAHGNEPSHHMAYLYNYINKPAKTDAMVKRLLTEFYTTQPDGLIGNEDCGQMSAWYVLSSLGLYAVTPGKAEYTLTKPLFDDYTVHLENGNTFSKSTIENALGKERFISHFTLMGEKEVPMKQWTGEAISYLRAPIIESESISFDDSLTVTISVEEPLSLAYRFITEGGDTSEWIFQEAWNSDGHNIQLIQKTTIQTYAFYAGFKSHTIPATFYKVPHPKWEVELATTYNPQYSAGGPKGIIDGIFGDENWRKGKWQGYQDQNFEAMIKFNETVRVSELSASFLQDTRSWILMPTKVEFYLSKDGIYYELVATIGHEVADNDYDVQCLKLKTILKKPIPATHVKIKAYNYGTLPKWHQGAGFEAFIFVDEVEVK